jgi:uncharacterized protein (DUF427 family)
MHMDDPDSLELARSQWRWRGKHRPPFADVPAQGQVSVWDFPRPPTFYLPMSDVNTALLQSAGRGSFCEWKGPALYWDLLEGEHLLPRVAWSYPQPLAGAEPLANCIAFYAHHLDCTVDGQRVVAQSGGFYGGWTP